MSTNFAKEFKLYESMFSEQKQYLTEDADGNSNNTSAWDWTARANWRAKNAPASVYVVMTDDGPGYEDSFLTWTTRGNYYTTVDYLRGVSRWDIHPTVADAEDRARDADSGTWGGWPSPMQIIEITNFRAAYYGGHEPEYTIVKTLNFNGKQKQANIKAASKVTTTGGGNTQCSGFVSFVRESDKKPEADFQAATKEEVLDLLLNYINTLTDTEKKNAVVTIYGADHTVLISIQAYSTVFDRNVLSYWDEAREALLAALDD